MCAGSLISTPCPLCLAVGMAMQANGLMASHSAWQTIAPLNLAVYTPMTQLTLRPHPTFLGSLEYPIKQKQPYAVN